MSGKNGKEFTGTERFVMVRRIGAGGMGVVYEAHDRQRNERVALKTLPQVEAAALYYLKQEFRSLTDVTHPNLVALHELISSGDQWFFTMELVNGVNFLDHVRAGPGIAVAESDKPTAPLSDPGDSQRGAADPTPTTSSPAPAALVATVPSNHLPLLPANFGRLRAALGQLAAGVCALHAAGKLHRDIKPSNVLVTAQDRVVLLDFGLVTELGESLDGQGESQIAGTYAYMAPEQAAGRALSPASDWYSVGVMLYEALTGRRPFHGGPVQVLRAREKSEVRSPSDLVTGLPEDLATLCAQLLRRRPKDRPTGQDILSRLGTAPAEPITSLPPAKTVFVGRERHLAVLRNAYQAMRQGRAVTVYVHGRSGVGKTSLIQRFLEEIAASRDAVILTGRCYERESVPYKALDSLVDALTRYLGRLPRDEIVDLLPRDVAALARLFPVLRRVDAIAPQPPPGNPDPHELRRQASGALRELLGRLGDRGPLVLAIDDLQWGDSESAALLTELLRPPDAPALLLLGSYRSEYAARSPCLRALLEAPGALNRHELAVEELTPFEAHHLALGLLGQDNPATQARAQAIAQESGGSPYFVRELVHAVQAGAEVPESSPAARITLDEVLWHRVERLPPASRRLLEVVTVSGQPLRQLDAYHAAGLDTADHAALTVLRVGHLVRSTGPREEDEVETYHDRIRETVGAHLPPAALLDHHHRLANTLEASGRADPETLAVHFLGAGSPERAGHYYALAAAEAAEALAFGRAANLYRLALVYRPVEGEAGRSLRTKLGDALANAGRGVEAAREYQAASEGAGAGEALELQRRAAFQYCISGHVDEGRAAFRTVLETVGMRLPGTPRRAILSYLLSQLRLRLRGLHFRRRDPDEVAPRDLTRIDITRSVAVGISVVDPVMGANFQTRSLLLALQAGEPLRIALSLAWEAAHAALAGGPNWQRTARLIDAAESLAQQINHPHALGMAELAAGIGEFFMGRFPTAGEHSDRAEAIFHDRCTGVMWELHTARAFGLWSLLYRGEFARLRERFLVLFQEARERGDRYDQANLGTQIGTLARLAADEVEEGREQLREVMSHWTQQGFNIQHLSAVYGRIYLDLYTGDGPTAWSRVEQMWLQCRHSLLNRIQQVRIDMLQLSGRSALAAAATAADPRPLLSAAEGYARRLEREKMPWADALARLLRAGVAARRGNQEVAVKRFGEAVAGFEAVQMGMFAAAARRRLGELLGGDEGSNLVADAAAWMAGQKITDPARMTAAFAPELLNS